MEKKFKSRIPTNPITVLPLKYYRNSLGITINKMQKSRVRDNTSI